MPSRDGVCAVCFDGRGGRRRRWRAGADDGTMRPESNFELTDLRVWCSDFSVCKDAAGFISILCWFSWGYIFDAAYVERSPNDYGCVRPTVGQAQNRCFGVPAVYVSLPGGFAAQKEA
eukprot:1503708-Pyramimonas_sp.AAC.1